MRRGRRTVGWSTVVACVLLSASCEVGSDAEVVPPGITSADSTNYARMEFVRREAFRKHAGAPDSVLAFRIAEELAASPLVEWARPSSAVRGVEVKWVFYELPIEIMIFTAERSPDDATSRRPPSASEAD